MDSMLEETQDKQRRAIEEEFLSRHKDRLTWNSQYQLLPNIVLLRARTVADKAGLDAEGFEEKLHEAESIVEDITLALRACWEDPPDDRFWYKFDGSQITNKPEEWTAASPISPGALDVATALYLERPWMQSNLLDWYILNGFVTDEMFSFQERFLSGSALGETNWAYMFSNKKKIMSALLWRFGLEVAKFALTWLFLPALAAVAYYLSYILAAQLILGTFGVWVLFRIIFLPGRFMRRRARNRRVAELEDGLNQLIRIQVEINSCSTLNPTVLREQVNRIRENTVVVYPAVYSILDRAIARDPAVFTKNDTPEAPLR